MTHRVVYGFQRRGRRYALVTFPRSVRRAARLTVLDSVDTARKPVQISNTPFQTGENTCHVRCVGYACAVSPGVAPLHTEAG